MIEARELALVTVERAGQVCNSNVMLAVTLAIDVLDVLLRVEYELIGGELQKLLGAIVGVGRIATSALHADNRCCSATTFGPWLSH